MADGVVSQLVIETLSSHLSPTAVVGQVVVETLTTVQVVAASAAERVETFVWGPL